MGRGDTAQFGFSVTNNGPATIYSRSGESIAPVTVTPPPGTTVTASSASCQPASADPATITNGPYEYGDPAGAYLVPAGHTSTFTLTVRVDQYISGARAR